MNQFRQKFQQDLKSQAQKEKKLGKLIIVSGMSGAGKSVVGDILVNDHNYIYINKYVTRDFRIEEKEAVAIGKPCGIRPVVGKYNEASDKVKKQAFLNLQLPLSYTNYDNYYGFSKTEIDTYLNHGKNVVVIVNDITLVRDLKNIYNENCSSCYVHRSNPKNKDIFMEIAKQRGDTPESAEKRYQKAIKDFDRYTNNISLYDHIILNTQNGIQRLSQMLLDLDTRDNQKIQQEKTMKQGNSPKIYVFIGNPGSGKDKALETIRVQSILHSLIMPKHTTRKRNEDDGEEMICPGDPLFNMDSCDLQYENYGSIYGINTEELQERLNNGISSSIVVSNEGAIQTLKEKFPHELVCIYIHGLSKEEYMIQQKEHLDDEYVKKRLAEYDKTDELYYNQWLDINHVIVDNEDSTDLKLQIDNIMRYYEEGRDWSPNAIDHYLQTASRYASKYKRNLTNEMNSKEEII